MRAQAAASRATSKQKKSRNVRDMIGHPQMTSRFVMGNYHCLQKKRFVDH